MTDTAKLFRQSAIGAFWLGGGQVLSQIIHLLVRLILARLLTPADFGLMAIAMLVLNFTTWFLDMGMGTALVQRKEVTEAHRSTAFWTNVLVSLLIFIILLCSAPLFAQFFQTEQLTLILVCLGFNIVILSPQATLENLLMRDIQFNAIASRRFWGTCVGGVVGILLAATGFGIWALVAEALIDSLIGTVLLLLHSQWRPKWVFEWQAFRELWHYSYPLIYARLFTFFNRNLDTLLIGRFLGATALGYYNLGYQFVLMPLLYITRPLSAVLFASLSKLQGDEARLRNGYLHAVSLISLVILPVMTIIVLVSPTLVPVMLGEQWKPATFLIPFFCCVGTIQAIQHLYPAVFQATGYTNLVARWTLITLVVNILTFSVGLIWGIQGVTIAYTYATVLIAPFLQRLLLKVLKLSWMNFIQTFLKSAIVSLVVAFLWKLLEIGYKVNNTNISVILEVSSQVVIFISFYLLISWYWNPLLRNTWQQLRFSIQSK